MLTVLAVPEDVAVVVGLCSESSRSTSLILVPNSQFLHYGQESCYAACLILTTKPQNKAIRSSSVKVGDPGKKSGAWRSEGASGAWSDKDQQSSYSSLSTIIRENVSLGLHLFSPNVFVNLVNNSVHFAESPHKRDRLPRIVHRGAAE